jgi:hypothetical protein
MRAPSPALAPAAERASERASTWRALLPACVGVLLSLTAVGSARVLDDHVLALQIRGDSELVTPRGGLDLFQFTSGAARDNLALMAHGSMLPWWSDPGLKIAFYRPASSLLHRIDYALWPDHPEFMYLHTLVWFALLLVLVARLYARFEAPSGAASLASWLYALNDAHGPVVSWLSNRNAILSAVGVIAALLAHRRAQTEGHAWSRALAPVWLLLALLAGELGLSAWAFLVAHATALETGPWQRRLRSLWPFALVTAGWWLLQVASGAGTHASGVYLHPLADFAAFARRFPERALLLVGAAFGPIPAEAAFFGARPLLPVWCGIGATTVAALLWIGKAELLAAPAARFWAMATLLAVVPVAASFPSDRLLVLVNVGAMALVSHILVQLWRSRARLGRTACAIGVFFLLVHAAAAPLLLPWRAHQMQQLGAAIETAFACLDTVPDLGRKTLIVLGAPADFVVSYLQADRESRHVARPEHVYWVANPEGRLEFSVIDERTLSLEREGGFFTTPPEALYRDPSRGLALGETVRLPELTARVTSTNAAGKPAQIELRLDHPLGDGRYLFLAFLGHEFQPVSVERLARLHTLPAASLLAFLAGREGQ